MSAEPVRRPASGWSLPGIRGLRGAGLGNEVISWAKAFIGAQELGLRATHPAWGANPRGYWRDFGTSRLDWLAHRAAAPFAVDISWSDVRSTGYEDYALALRVLRDQLPLDRRPVVVRHVSGMAGGFPAIHRARPYLVSQLTRPVHVVPDLYRIFDRLPGADTVTVAVHVRAGDFADAGGGPAPGTFNQRIPAEWYVRLCRSLRDGLDGRVSFVVLSDDPDGPLVRRLVDHLGAVLPPVRRLPLLSDLALMAAADLVVCSVSSLSMLGVFLSDKPYIWYAPHLERTGGWRSIWGGEPDQLDGPTARNRSAASAGPGRVGRGVAVDRNGAVPAVLIEDLKRTSERRDRAWDLVMYGVVPDHGRDVDAAPR